MDIEKGRKYVVFHPTIATYRIDFFNSLAKRLNCTIYLLMRKFVNFRDYDSIEKQFAFVPGYVFDEGDERIRAFSFRYWKILDKEDPDVVLTFEFGSCPMMIILHKLLKRKKYKIITTCDDSPDIYLRGRLRHRICRMLCQPFLDDVIYSSDEVCELSRKQYGKGLYFPIIRNGENARNKLSSLLPLSESIASEYGLSSKCVIGFVGRLAPEKNIGELIEAFSISAGESDCLVLIGDGPERQNLESLAKQNNTNALFLGRLEGDDLYAWYNLIDILVLPSKSEAFGAVTNEALLAGCVVIVSNRCGSKCLIRNGINGYVYPFGSVSALSDAILESKSLALDRRDKLSLKKDMMMDDYDSLFNALIKAI